MNKTTQLKEMILEPDILVVPSAYDALSAKVIEKSGFRAVHMTGSGTSASLLGYPDMGFTTIPEMANHAKNIGLAVDLPVIVDSDSGYGNALNVTRAVREFERAGVAGIHIEDQVTPKRCGHLEGKRVIPAEEMVGKIEAAVAAREDDDFQLIARTDARECTGIEDAIERANAYVEAGADCIFFEAPLNADEMRLVRDEVDAPLLANMVEGGKTPWFTVPELEELGFGLVIYPLSGWMAAAAVLRELMKELRETGTTQGFWDRMGLQMSFEELFDLFDYPQFQSLEDRYVVR
ncbi:MAG: carboxyvinyl-carboxyphosphonate phosphorylmutase [Actinobacteria bacterium]|nr:MAG: carboxyvinyl-carboxyphosphonate phosphorylmutase [Actinomycetota bacterium]